MRGVFALFVMDTLRAYSHLPSQEAPQARRRWHPARFFRSLKSAWVFGSDTFFVQFTIIVALTSPLDHKSEPSRMIPQSSWSCMASLVVSTSHSACAQEATQRPRSNYNCAIGSHESYVRAILASAVRPKFQGGLGYRGIVVNFRGCTHVSQIQLPNLLS